MIVRNEAHVIRRCLESVRPLVDTWLIVDTGSSDGTQGIVCEHFKDIPGELFERPWRDFGHNRSEALALARDRADYVFVIDADDMLVVPPGFVLPALTLDAYSLPVEDAGATYWRMCVAATRLEWRYVGVLHEYLTCGDDGFSRGNLPELKIVRTMEGGRGKGIDRAEKYANDARVLERALAEEPGNARYVFYLAQSYRDCGQLRKSLKTYQRRAAMGGWDEEVWYSLYEVARLSERLGLPSETVVDRYLAAFQFRPQRAEPLVELARFHRERKQFALAYLFALRATGMPKPDDILFLDAATYAWRALDEFAVASYWVCNYQEALRACELLLDNASLPYDQLTRVTENLNFSRDALRKGGAQFVLGETSSQPRGLASKFGLKS